MLGEKVIYSDLGELLDGFLDPEDDVDDYDLTFTDPDGSPLIENGKEKEVTNENKKDYCYLIVEKFSAKDVDKQLTAFLKGFHDFLHPKVSFGLTYDHLRVLLSVEKDISLDDWKKVTAYNPIEFGQSEVVQWFWEILGETPELKRAVFAFTTGMSYLPVGGFKNLFHKRSDAYHFEIMKIDGTDRLPEGNTCFNTLKFASYPSKEILRAKLTRALDEAEKISSKS